MQGVTKKKLRSGQEGDRGFLGRGSNRISQSMFVFHVNLTKREDDIRSMELTTGKQKGRCEKDVR